MKTIRNKDEAIIILDYEEVQTCSLCNAIMQIKVGEAYPSCPVHQNAAFHRDILIYYTVRPYTKIQKRREGWKTKTGKEIRAGRYGLVVKDSDLAIEQEEFMLNMLSSLKYELERGEVEVWAILISELLS